MPVKVKCSNCDKVLSVPDAARGKAIKCPQCQSRIAIPAADTESSSKSSVSKSKPKKPARPADSEAALATFDMRRAEDTEARVCPKCGFDMQYQDEEDNECPQCGYDSGEGGMGAKARKKAMKGPDPADFYPGLSSGGWKFVSRNQMLAIRTVIYTLVCLAIALGCGFLYLWISAWPPRWFLALCFTISFLVIPGWMWFLDTEVIKLTLERKDKFKKLNFDFFLASAMGGAFVFWCVTIALPVVAIPGGLGYVLVNYGGMTELVFPICLGVGAFFAIWMLPVTMSHMSMPVQYKGWMVWKVVPMWAQNIKPLSVWLLWFLLTNLPAIGGTAVIAAVYGSSISSIVRTMEDNAAINRRKAEGVVNPNSKGKIKPGDLPVVQAPIPDLAPVDFKPLIVPCVILFLMCIANGFTCMFNMRTNGQFTYYNKNSLDMVDRLKEKKYKAIERRGDADDEKPKTTSQLIVEALAFILVFDLLGLVGGMLYGSFSTAGMTAGLFYGACIGHAFALLGAAFLNIKMAFEDSPKWGAISLLYPIGFVAFVFQNWEDRKGAFMQMIGAIVPAIGLVIGGFTSGMFDMSANSAQQNQAPPGGMMQSPDPSQPAPGGAHAPGGAPAPGGAHMPNMSAPK